VSKEDGGGLLQRGRAFSDEVGKRGGEKKNRGGQSRNHKVEKRRIQPFPGGLEGGKKRRSVNHYAYSARRSF